MAGLIYISQKELLTSQKSNKISSEYKLST
jgi:hypothetical protein